MTFYGPETATTRQENRQPFKKKIPMMTANPTTGLNPMALNQINFDGDSISVVVKDGQYCVALKPLAEAMGLDWEAQRQLIERDAILALTACTIQAVGSDGKQRDMVSLPLEYLNGWLFKINSTRYQGEHQDKIIRYQKECYRVLYSHFFPSASQADQDPTIRQDKEKKTQLKEKTSINRLELNYRKSTFGMDQQAEKEAERIFKGNGSITDLDLCPGLQALTRAALEKLNQGDLFNHS